MSESIFAACFLALLYFSVRFRETQGWGSVAGAGIAACCDIRIGTKTTKFGFPIARTLGNCLSMSNISRLTALIGPARVKDLIFTARLVGAEEAASVGLLNEVVDDVAALARRADELAALIAGNAPLTLNATKQALARLQQASSPLDRLPALPTEGKA